MPKALKYLKYPGYLAIVENLQSKVYLQCKSNVNNMQYCVDLNYIMIFLYIKYLQFSVYMNYI